MPVFRQGKEKNGLSRCWSGSGWRIGWTTCPVSCPEDSRKLIREGDPAIIELEADEGHSYQGTVSMVSALGVAGEEETTYSVLIDFAPDDAAQFGMSVIVTIGEDEESQDGKTDAGTAEETTETADGKSGRGTGKP